MISHFCWVMGIIGGFALAEGDGIFGYILFVGSTVAAISIDVFLKDNS